MAYDRVGRVVHLVPLGVVEAQYLESVEVAPVVVEVSQPIVNHTFECSTEIQLVPEGIELDPEVDVL